jgi:hypothetical protein
MLLVLKRMPGDQREKQKLPVQVFQYLAVAVERDI